MMSRRIYLSILPPVRQDHEEPRNVQLSLEKKGELTVERIHSGSRSGILGQIGPKSRESKSPKPGTAVRTEHMIRIPGRTG
jgi:hypothetical protein